MLAKVHRLCSTGELIEARRLCDAVLAADARNPSAVHFMGLILAGGQEHEQAVGWLRRSIELRPNEPDFHNNLGTTLGSLDRHADAAAAFAEAVRLRPSHGPFRLNLGKALRRAGRIDEAVTHLREAVRLEPASSAAYRELAAGLETAGSLDEGLIYLRRAVELSPSDASLHSDFLLHILHRIGDDPAAMREEHRLWAERHAEPLYPRESMGALFPHLREELRPPARRLRLGYLSSDFRQHPVATFIEEVLRHHDRGKLEVSVYSDVKKADRKTGQLREWAEHWYETAEQDDQALLQLIRADRIDVLVDLTGHCEGGKRMPMLARRAAPVQAHYIGYPATTGLATLDYRITNDWHDPPRLDGDRFYTERLVRIPGGCWCYHAPDDAPEVSELPATRNGYVTFAALNRLAKVSPEMIGLWARILDGIPRSRLMLGVTRSESLEAMFRSNGIDPSRLIIAERTRPIGYLRRYLEADLALDTFPYAGHTTTCDAMWMGVPTITLAGKTHCSRAGVSMNEAVGLNELVAETPEAFVRAAIELGQNLTRLQTLRLELRDCFRRSTMMDGSTVTRNLESAYAAMWRQRCS